MNEESQKSVHVMISLTGCRTCERVQLSVASHLLSDLNPPDCNAPEVEITLQNLHSLLENPSLSKNVKRLDSVDTLTNELVACAIPGVASSAEDTAYAVFVDITSAHQKRDCMSLLKVSQTVRNIIIIAATGPDLTPHASAPRSVGMAAQHMLTELLHGVDCTNAVGISSSKRVGNDEVKVRAGVMAVQIQPVSNSLQNVAEENCQSSSSLLLERDRMALDACSLVQVQFRSGERVQPPPPLFIQMMTLGDQTHSSPLLYLHDKGVDLSSIAMCGNELSLANVSYFESLLRRFPGFMLLLDCFGSVEKPVSDNIGEYNNHPCDEEICQAIKYLISTGYVNRLIITSSVTSKLNLINYGGAGYYHIQRSVIPRLLRRDISAEHIHQLTVSNLSTFVTWYIPPPEIPVERETFQCFICDKKSCFGEHYEKFEFLYCTSKCLREHAKRKWAK